MSKPIKDAERVSFTIEEFCARHRLSRSTYYDLRKRGLGPQEMKSGRWTRISRASEDVWLAKMEAGGQPADDDTAERRRAARRKRRRARERD